MRKWILLSSIIFILVVLSLVTILNSSNGANNLSAQLINQVPTPDPSKFQQVEQVRDFSFPEDHGPHPGYQTEWWYYTGNLESDEGLRFGYQLTFFRRALIPSEEITPRKSTWGTNQAYLAHFALTNIQKQNHQSFERLARGATGLAGAQTYPFQVWLENWRVEETDFSDQCLTLPPCAYQLTATQGDIQLELTLQDLKGPILQGDRGLSRKGNQAGQASYYYSLTRLESNGKLVIGKSTYNVSGWSWMDHEFSTSALSKEQVGWDWFSIQLDDGSELMVFQIRRQDGSIDPYSSGTLIGPDGSTIHLNSEDFIIEVKNIWKSPYSKASYPANWQIKIANKDLVLDISPYLADQELNLSYTYWEGAVKVEGKRGRQNLSGYGYVELTGYAGSMGGEF